MIKRSDKQPSPKPCPFCGSEARIRNMYDVVDWTDDDEPMAESKHSTIEELEKEPCEDAISRADILEEIEKLRMSSGVTNQSTWNECVDVILRTVRNRDWFPSVQPTLIKASDIQPDDEWMQENEWDEIYEKESEDKE